MLRLVTWNVNSIASRLPRVLQYIARAQPDVLCFQEIKCMDEKFPTETFTSLGYHCAVFGQKTYNGVAIVSREKPLSVTRGFASTETPADSRLIWADFEKYSVASAYIPNGQEVGSPKYSYKLEWLGKLKTFLQEKSKTGRKFSIVGDFNVAPEDRDCHDPKAWAGKILFSDAEKKALSEVVGTGLIDVFRTHNTQGGLYSWWDYRGVSFPYNKGMRIDFIYSSPEMAALCKSAHIERDERKGEKPSDHAPVVADFLL